jgi:acetolactate synthase small subunit
MLAAQSCGIEGRSGAGQVRSTLLPVPSMVRRLSFVLSAKAHPELLDRVARVFRRLAIPVEALTMKRIDSGRIRMTIEVLARTDESEAIVASLSKIIYVLSVTHDIQDEDSANWPRPLP